MTFPLFVPNVKKLPESFYENGTDGWTDGWTDRQPTQKCHAPRHGKNEAECVIYIKIKRKTKTFQIPSITNESSLTYTHTEQVLFLSLTLNDMRVVLQEKVVQVFGNEGRHAGICQGCED